MWTCCWPFQYSADSYWASYCEVVTVQGNVWSLDEQVTISLLCSRGYAYIGMMVLPFLERLKSIGHDTMQQLMV